MNNQLHSRVMQKVYFIYSVRRILASRYLKLVILLSCIGAETVFMSVRHVIANAPSPENIEALYHFFSGAFAHTELTSKILFVGSILLFAFFMRDLIWGERTPGLQTI